MACPFSVVEYILRRLRFRNWGVVSLFIALPGGFATGAYVGIYFFTLAAALGLRIVDDLASTEYERLSGDPRFYHAGSARNSLAMIAAGLLLFAGSVLVAIEYPVLPYIVYLAVSGLYYFLFRRSAYVTWVSLLKYPAAILGFWPIEKSGRIALACLLFLALLLLISELSKKKATATA